MHFTVRCVVALGLLGFSIAGCSSDKPVDDTSDGGEMGTGGKGAGGKGGASQGTGGKPPIMCSAETHNDGCRKCLAGACCSDYTACVNSPSCNQALDDQAACVAVPGSETSTCFGALSRALYGDSGVFPPVLACFIMDCSAGCGAPGPV
jgi:hypothetical protein